MNAPIAGLDAGSCAKDSLSGPGWWICTGLVLVGSLLALVPTTGDFGLTYDEPAYMYSQQVSVQWWERLVGAKSWSDIREVMDADALLYYWPYAMHGINFHPPLAGQLNLLSHHVFARWCGDIPSRRLASVIEFAVTVTLLFGFMARRYGGVVGVVAAGSLLLMPRLYGQAHLIDTDIPGLLLWAATALAVWKGLYEPAAHRWRVAVGVLAGLAFVEKMAAVMVLLPVFVWLGAVSVNRLFRKGSWAAWVDGLLTLGAMAVPIAVALFEVVRISRALPLPQFTNLHVHRPTSIVPGAILAVPAVVWVVRRLLGRTFPASQVWGVERRVLETVTSIVAFAPLTAWLGNPEWWRESMTRLGHYFALNTSRRGALPDIQILYFGEIFEFSLPWHNAWVLIAITVPLSILIASVVGLVVSLARRGGDWLPVYFLIHLVTLPIVRMFPTPGHDGVRLFLPTFFILAAFAGWGAGWAAKVIGRGARWAGLMVAIVVFGPATWELISVHPYELSYYNVLIGGPPGAVRRGFELSYWYDAFTPKVLEQINRKLPEGAVVMFPNQLSRPSTFQDLQAQGLLRGDIDLGSGNDAFPYLWLLTHDSKASANTRLLFALEPWFTVRPRQLGGVRVVTVADPVAAARSRALQLLLDAAGDTRAAGSRAPAWVRSYVPWLARLWGDGLTRANKLGVNEAVLDWARTDPNGLRGAAAEIVEWAESADRRPMDPVRELTSAAGRLYREIARYDGQTRYSEELLRKDPTALAEAVEIVIRRPDAVRRVITRYGYTDGDEIGGYLDMDLAKR